MKFHEFGDEGFASYLADTWRWQFLVELSSSSTDLIKEYRVILPTLNGHGEEHHIDYVSTEDSAWRS